MKIKHMYDKGVPLCGLKCSGITMTMTKENVNCEDCKKRMEK